MAAEQAYGYTVPARFGGLGGRYLDFADVEESLATTSSTA